jgi:hypothetical protein
VHKYLLPGYIGALFRVVSAADPQISRLPARLINVSSPTDGRKMPVYGRPRFHAKQTLRWTAMFFSPAICFSDFDPLLSAALVPS